MAIIHLLVALATHFHANVRLPEHVSIPVVVLSKENNKIKQVEILCKTGNAFLKKKWTTRAQKSLDQLINYGSFNYVINN